MTTGVPSLHPPARAEVHLWLIPVTAATMSDVLTDEEQSLAISFTDPTRRRHFVAARGASRQILAAYLGRTPRSLDWRTGPYGKPYLAEPAGALPFNLSHSGNLALLAVTQGRGVGVDIERLRTDGGGLSVAERFFPRAEADALRAEDENRRAAAYGRLWARKEACVKAAGGRLGQGLGLHVGTAPGRTLVRDRVGGLEGPWTVADITVSAGYAAAVALQGHEEFRQILLASPAFGDGDQNSTTRRFAVPLTGSASGGPS